MWALQIWDCQGSSLDLPNPGNNRENPLGWRHAKTGMGREPCSPLPALRRRTLPRAPESLSTGAVMGAVRLRRALPARGLNKTQQRALTLLWPPRIRNGTDPGTEQGLVRVRV